MNDVGVSATERRVLIDGYNVLHAVLLREERQAASKRTLERDSATPDDGMFCWWRAEYQRRVVAWACQLGDVRSQAGPKTVVFDASHEVPAEQRVTSHEIGIVYAPNADDWIVDACKHARCIVITADRTLCERARVFGATCVRPWDTQNTPSVLPRVHR